MKRISSLLSAFIILLSAVACGSTTNTPSDTTVPTVTDDTATSEVMDSLGLGSAEKGMLVALAGKSAAEN